MAKSKIYGEHYLGIPINPPYQDGVLVRNKGGENFPPKVLNKDGNAIPYKRWEDRYFANPQGRPKKYSTDEERKAARKVYNARAKAKKKEKKWQDFLNKIKLTGE